MWKGSGFKGVAAYGHEFIKESLLDRDLQVENLFELHTQMNVKGFLVKDVYLASMKEASQNQQLFSIWTSSDEKEADFCQKVFKFYPELLRIRKNIEILPKSVSRSVCSIHMRNYEQKTL